MQESERQEHDMARRTEQQLHLIGFWTGPETDRTTLYTFILNDDGDLAPLIAQESILFFTHLELAETALSTAGVSPPWIFDTEEVICYNVPAVMRLLQTEDLDPSARILNLINILDDMLIGLQVRVPRHYQSALDAVADHLTFEREYGQFFAESNVTRETTIEGIQWCLGVVFARMWLLAPS